MLSTLNTLTGAITWVYYSGPNYSIFTIPVHYSDSDTINPSTNHRIVAQTHAEALLLHAEGIRILAAFNPRVGDRVDTLLFVNFFPYLPTVP